MSLPETLLAACGVGWSVDERPILRPLEVEIAAGECLAVVGPNGAGKTTLLRLLAGLLTPAAGELAWRGAPYADLTRRQLAKRIAYVPQVRSAAIPLTVEQMVLLGRFPYLSPWQMAPDASDRARVDEVLETVGLAPLRTRAMATLSGGERQAVFIAAALAQEAELLLLDEPTTHLDARHQVEICDLLVGIAQSPGRAIVLTTHDLDLAATLADRILALAAGRVAALGPPDEILRSERLEAIFGAPFSVLRDGERSHVVLQLDR